MAVTDVLSGPLPEAIHRSQLRRAIIASTVGTTIEWYDFLLYSTVTGLVFGKLFFPNSDPLVGVLQAFAVYAVGFIARPIGAAIFGHYGDRSRPQSGADRNFVDHRLRHVRRWLSSHLQINRHLGRRNSYDHPVHSGNRHWGRMGRLSVTVDGVGAHECASRLRRFLAAIWWTGRIATRQCGSLDL